MRKQLLLAAAVMMAATLQAQNLRRVSIHDPSVVYDSQFKRYYLFGTHRGLAFSSDMQNWNDASSSLRWKVGTNTNANFLNAFSTNATKTVTIGGQDVAFGNFDAKAWSAAYGNYDLTGNMWAPDAIWNKKMQKWCLYYSINGPEHNSSIVLLTADKIAGPYEYQGPVVFSGFNKQVDGKTIDGVSYKLTDLELAIGQQTSLPARYNRGSSWGSFWPHCIDPCVFYDEDGLLWLAYGSWSGGIWMLRLNEDNGLRDYDVKYSITGSGQNVTSDPYFGRKIAGGWYVSGEGSYIEHIGNYYYLFVSYGFMLSASQESPNDGGYQMRVFRSLKPDGPYVDASGKSAVFTSYAMNYGPGGDTRGVNILGAYGGWGYMTKGEREQGHNSIIAADDGRTYLVYHTRFENGGQGHQVRVHQVFQNRDGWLVAAPFEYTGEKVTSADIATTQQVAYGEVVGAYKLLFHKYGLKYKWGEQELATPVDVSLCVDGTIKGDRKGLWTIEPGTSYVTLTIGTEQYRGVFVRQTMEPRNEQTIAFSAVAKSGVTIWGYRAADDPTGLSDFAPGGPDVPTVGTPSPLRANLQGQRVSQNYRGIVISGGRKVLQR